MAARRSSSSKLGSWSRYQRAYDIISRLHQQRPDKNGYYVDQLRFLEKLMLNSKKKSPEKKK